MGCFLCKSLEKLNISSFDTGNVEMMRQMFNGCESLGELDVNHFDTSKIANLRSFSEYTELPDNVALKSADNTLMASSDIDYIFGKEMDRKQIKTIYFRNRKKGIGENAWDVSEKQDGSIMAWMEEKDGLSDLYIAANGNIKANKDCTNLFGNYSSLENIYGMEYFRTNDTENMEMMFVACNSLQSIDVSGFDTSQVVSMAWMFAGCVSLQNIDVSHFNTASVGTMSDMFFGCDSLQSLDIRNFVIHDFWTMHEPFVEHIGLPKQVPLKRNRPAKVKKLRNSTIWKLAQRGRNGVSDENVGR
ncbi:MAG: BspA family leucine-rich repeat surface protein [Blautia sp.]